MCICRVQLDNINLTRHVHGDRRIPFSRTHRAHPLTFETTEVLTMSGVQPRKSNSPISVAKAKAARSKADTLTSEVSLQYLRHHNLPVAINEILTALLASQPSDPLATIERELRDMARKRAAAAATKVPATTPQSAPSTPTPQVKPVREKVAAHPTQQKPALQQATTAPSTPTPVQQAPPTAGAHVVFVEDPTTAPEAFESTAIEPTAEKTVSAADTAPPVATHDGGSPAVVEHNPKEGLSTQTAEVAVADSAPAAEEHLAIAPATEPPLQSAQSEIHDLTAPQSQDAPDAAQLVAESEADAVVVEDDAEGAPPLVASTSEGVE